MSLLLFSNKVEHIRSLIALREKRLFPDERRVGETVHGVDRDDSGGGGESFDQVVVLRHLAILVVDGLHLQSLTEHSSEHWDSFPIHLDPWLTGY